MKGCLFTLVFVLSTLVAGTQVWAVSLTLYPTHDSEIIWSLGTGPGGSVLSDANYGNTQYLTVNSGAPGAPTMYIGANSYGLVQFDTSSIPMGSSVESASLTLYQGSSAGFSGRTVSLYPITSAWDESTVTYNTRPSWDTAEVSSLVIPDPFINQYRTWDVTGVVQDWVDGLIENFGLITSDVHINVGSTTRHYIRFYSSEAGGINLDPRLEISFTPIPAPATLLLLGSGLAGLAGFRRRFKKA